MTKLGMPFRGIVPEPWVDVADYLHRVRVVEAFRNGVSAFPAFRREVFSARMTADELLDEVASIPGWACERLREDVCVAFGEDFLARLAVTRSLDRISVSADIHANSVSTVEQFLRRLTAIAGRRMITDPMLTLVWTFLDAKRELNRVEVAEIADEECLDAAYPMIDGGANAFIERYLASPETVLVLQGPPGTGKTRLIRHIMGGDSRRRGEPAKAVYTADQAAMETDRLFVSFITGRERFLIVEDADHLLRAREDGNEVLHRFLAIADGVVSAQGRKIIFTTNLPTIGDVDSALVRPGRCFAHSFIRRLGMQEASVLLSELGQRHGVPTDRIIADLVSSGESSFSLAEIYRRFRDHDRPVLRNAAPPKQHFGFVG